MALDFLFPNDFKNLSLTSNAVSLGHCIIIYSLNNFGFVLYFNCILYLYHRDVDQVHDMMDDIAEQQDVAREISDAISNPVAFGQDADEDELEKELEELQQEQLDKELLGIDTTTDELPAVPTSVPVAPSKIRTSINYFS